jgi:uncharacterized cofD-like protein
MRENLKIAVIGGGTGSFTLLSALKDHTHKLTALVTMADDGGSTGVLRDELGVLPPGDVRQCLVALSSSPELRDLFNYRFDDGALKGHAFGNLFLTALEKTTGDFARGVEVASEVLNIIGRVEPITLTNVRLVMREENGEETCGQYEIGSATFNGRRSTLWLEPHAVANPKAIEAIMDADMVVIAPGNLYGSLAPALVVPGIGDALAHTKALRLYVCNLVTKPGQTAGYTVTDFANEIERFAARPMLDVVLFNTETPSEELLQRYAKSGEMAVTYDGDGGATMSYEVVGAPLLSGKVWQNTNTADPIANARTLIRHDSKALASAIIDIYDTHAAR